MAERTVRIALRDAKGLITQVVESTSDDPLVLRIGELERELNELRGQLSSAEQRRVVEVKRVRDEQRATAMMLESCRDSVIDDLTAENRHLRETVATLRVTAERVALNSTRTVLTSTRLVGQALGTIETALRLDEDPYDTPPTRRRTERPTMDANERAIYAFAASLNR